MKRSTSVVDKPTDEQIADAMRALEPGLADLVLMTRIVTDLLERLLRAAGEVRVLLSKLEDGKWPR